MYYILVPSRFKIWGTLDDLYTDHLSRVGIKWFFVDHYSL